MAAAHDDATSETRDSARNYTVPAVDRAARILRFLKQHPGVGVSEIATKLDITRSNCFAILKTLHAHDFITFDPERKVYGLGLALFELGGAVSRTLEPLGVVRPYLLEYARNNNLSTFVVSRIGRSRLILLDKEETPGDIRLSVSIGTRLPITHGASGKCFMSFLPHGEAEELIDSVGVPATTVHTITALDLYRKELAQIRACGYCTSIEESTIGTNAIAAPVFNADGSLKFVLTAIGFTASLPSRVMKKRAIALREAAGRATHAMGGEPPDWSA